ncbi:MAG: energy-coupling factor transporter transmembrane protein EcfT [Clostridiaceae bacterium]|nr:energy-coupling factor transporter transmembrane protein EcfT [Clostridiaceae bacterium]
MIKDLSIGRYYRGDSVLHSLDPRVKVILFVVYMVSVFLLTKPIGLLFSFAVATTLALLSKIPFREIIKSVRPIVFLMIFIFVINLFTIQEGEELFRFWVIVITSGGILRACLMSFRLFLLIVSTGILLTLTTTPLKMSDALESLFGPLKKIRVPVHEMAMMMSIALRFIPTLVEETDKIMKAQASRGAEYDTGNIIVRAKGYVSVLVPLFVSSFKRAEELAVAMDARCYRGGEGRTKLHPLKMRISDYVWFFVLLILAFIPVLAEWIFR